MSVQANAPDRVPPVDIVIEDERWIDAGLEDLSSRAVAATAQYLGLGPVEVVVLGCNDERIAGLNDHFRGKSRPTNVLSWPVNDPEPRDPGARPALPSGHGRHAGDMIELGDIAIAYDTCLAEAAARAPQLRLVLFDLPAVAERARAAAREHDVDLVVTDFMMPKMDGLEFLHRLRGIGNTAEALPTWP